jgi:hypothetical protein
MLKSTKKSAKSRRRKSVHRINALPQLNQVAAYVQAHPVSPFRRMNATPFRRMNAILPRSCNTRRRI